MATVKDWDWDKDWLALCLVALIDAHLEGLPSFKESKLLWPGLRAMEHQIMQEEEKDEARAYVEACMRWVPKWAAGCPLNCESGVGLTYGDC